ncbi:hypothetical protein [Nocardioides sp.]|uniref:hypothetical protein n=1 Tax=Nocardioides sp. TaxID=35761 RepID=UPI002629041B|nr:hypothetical protein [Nocardioides sp.]
MRRVWGSLIAALAAGCASFVVLLPAAPAASSATGVTVSGEVSRTFYDETGTATEADRRTVRLTVSATTNLRSRQQIDVSWSGAHPTGGVALDLTSATAAREEYPFVLLQCRGQGAAVTPKTCWTASDGERYQRSSPTAFKWPAWRSDAAATVAERAQFVGAPDPMPSACPTVTSGASRWVPFVAADGTTYAGGPSGCAGTAPESAEVSDIGLPSNTTYGVTGANGKGSTRFSIWTGDDNGSLGCSASTACSLVAIPIEGLSCDAWGTQLPASAAKPTGNDATRADAACRGTDAYQAGDLQRPGDYNLSTSGLLWWSASNWDNRIQVPLSFALTSSVCGVVNKTSPLSLYGSILFNEVAAQWTPKFCTTRSLDPIIQVQAADGAARSMIDAGTATVALSTFAPDDGYQRPAVQAPVGVSGFAIAFTADDADGQRLTSLRLDARLIAKLLSESYPGNTQLARAYAPLADNPLNLLDDPEFQALNPDAPHLGVFEAASTLLTLNTDSDLMRALTSYLDQDTEARDFLNGVPDPWGMKVNPNYRHIELPVSQWPQLDTFTLEHDTLCYNYSPAPYLGLIASPVGQLATLIQDVQYAISNVTLLCSGDADAGNPATLKLRPQGRQTPGRRFLLGLVPLSAASRYGLDVADLQTTSSVPLADTFTSAQGRTFVAPDTAGLKAGAALLTPDTDRGLWTLPYASLHTAAGARAYPGTMPIFATVPVEGLSSATAARAAQFLRYAAGPGQSTGIAIGQLPAGLLPLTKASGLGALATYTTCAAQAVAAQSGQVPRVGLTSCPTTASASPSASTSATPAVVPAAPSLAIPDVVPSAPAAGGTVPVAAPGVATVAEPVLTVAATTGFGRYGLPSAAFAAVALLVFGAGLRWGEALSAQLVGALRRVRRVRR